CARDPWYGRVSRRRSVAGGGPARPASAGPAGGVPPAPPPGDGAPGPGGGGGPRRGLAPGAGPGAGGVPGSRAARGGAAPAGANRRMAASYDTVVCTTDFAREEFDRIGATNVRRVPLGVDLRAFTPSRRDTVVRGDLARGASTLMVHCGRLSPEKHVERSVDT